jgi:hypothetical protein
MTTMLKNIFDFLKSYLTSVSSTPFQGEPYCVCRTVRYLSEYVENTNTGFNSTGEKEPIDGVREQIRSSQRKRFLIENTIR